MQIIPHGKPSSTTAVFACSSENVNDSLVNVSAVLGVGLV